MSIKNTLNNPLSSVSDHNAFYATAVRPLANLKTYAIDI